jgi:hypothetical protein
LKIESVNISTGSGRRTDSLARCHNLPESHTPATHWVTAPGFGTSLALAAKVESWAWFKADSPAGSKEFQEMEK